MVAVADPLEQRVLRLESDVIILNRSLQGSSRLGRALRPTDIDEWASHSVTASSSPLGLSCLPTSVLSKAVGAKMASNEASAEKASSAVRLEERFLERVDEERRRREELQKELEGFGTRLVDVEARMNKAVQRLSAGQDALQEHCAEIAVATEAALQRHGASLLTLGEGDGGRTPLERLAASLEASEVRLEGRCTALESKVAALNATEILDERFAEIKSMVRKHCSAMQAQLSAAEPLVELLCTPRKEPPASPRKGQQGLARIVGSESLTSQETLSSIGDERELPTSRTTDEDDWQAHCSRLTAHVRSLGFAELLERLAEVRAAGEERCRRIDAQLEQVRAQPPSLESQMLVQRVAALETSTKDGLGRLGTRVDEVAASAAASAECPAAERLARRVASLETSTKDSLGHLDRRLDELAGSEPVSSVSDRLTLRMAAVEASCEGRCENLEAKLECRCGLLEARLGPKSVAEAVAAAHDKVNARVSAMHALMEQRCSQVETQVTQVCNQRRACTGGTAVASASSGSPH